MGCDYYTITALEVTFKLKNESTNLINNIELKRDRHNYYDYDGDSDEENYELNETMHYKNQLILTNYEKIYLEIYKNGSFINETLEKKYKKLIEEDMSKFLSYKNTIREKEYELISVIKKNYRRER